MVQLTPKTAEEKNFEAFLDELIKEIETTEQKQKEQEELKQPQVVVEEEPEELPSRLDDRSNFLESWQPDEKQKLLPQHKKRSLRKYEQVQQTQTNKQNNT